MNVQPVTLEGRNYHADVCEAGLNEELWRWIPKAVRTPGDIRGYIEIGLR